ncbi:MAG TPA: TatD family hydrolase [Opitutaceae bacterium]|nr:TatD family hydrolase [Opitutaceae bacterium]
MAELPQLIDTHAHLDRFHRRGELDAVLERARVAGVGRIVTIGTEPEDWRLYRELVPQLGGGVVFTAGLHPCSVDENWETALAELPRHFETGNGGAVAVGLGECGLDRFHLPKNDPAAAERIFAWQLAAFRAQLQLAKTLRGPLVVHSRGAFAETITEIDAAGIEWARVVFHCFSEGEAEMRLLHARGGRGSFTGIITYKNADNVRAALRAQGLASLMVETDSPYLPPEPHRGKGNEPAFVALTAAKAAELLDVPLVELAARTTANACAFFGLD